MLISMFSPSTSLLDLSPSSSLLPAPYWLTKLWINSDILIDNNSIITVVNSYFTKEILIITILSNSSKDVLPVINLYIAFAITQFRFPSNVSDIWELVHVPELFRLYIQLYIFINTFTNSAHIEITSIIDTAGD